MIDAAPGLSLGATPLVLVPLPRCCSSCVVGLSCSFLINVYSQGAVMQQGGRGRWTYLCLTSTCLALWAWWCIFCQRALLVVLERAAGGVWILKGMSWFGWQRVTGGRRWSSRPLAVSPPRFPELRRCGLLLARCRPRFQMRLVFLSWTCLCLTSTCLAVWAGANGAIRFVGRTCLLF